MGMNKSPKVKTSSGEVLKPMSKKGTETENHTSAGLGSTKTNPDKKI